LLNAFEAAVVTGSPCPMVDSFRVNMAPDPRTPKLLTALAEVGNRTQDPATVRGAPNESSWSLLDCTLRPPRARRSCGPRPWRSGTARR